LWVDQSVDYWAAQSAAQTAVQKADSLVGRKAVQKADSKVGLWAAWKADQKADQKAVLWVGPKAGW